jgi:hypothetical protein
MFTKKEIEEIITHRDKEKDEMNKIIENLRTSIVKKENLQDEFKRDNEQKKIKLKELLKELDNYKTELEICKMNLETEKKSRLAKTDELKNLTASFL